MAYNPPGFTPGGFNFDMPSAGSGSGRPASFSNVHPGLFQPPASPSVSGSAFFGRSTGQQSDGNPGSHSAKRKRTAPRDSTPFSDWGNTGDVNSNADNIIADRPDYDIHNDGRERQYVLAGQMDSSDGVARKELGYIENSVYSDVDYRRGLGSKRLHGDIDPSGLTPATTESSQPAAQRATGWGSYAISTIGGVVGKVWEFCTAGAFRGFYAGGGQGYQVSDAQKQPTAVDEVMHDPSSATPTRGLEPSPMQAGFRQPDQSSYPYEPDSPESTPPPAAKRRQLWNGSPNNDELQKNWVVVDEPASANRLSLASSVPSRSLPRRTAPRPASSLARRITKPVPRLSTPTFGRQLPSRPSSAAASPIPSRDVNTWSPSFTSARSPDAPTLGSAFTPSRIPQPARPQTPSHFSASQFTPQASRIPTPSSFTQRNHRRNQSNASTPAGSQSVHSKRDSIHEMHDNSPRLDAKARSLAAKRIQEEMEADSRMNDLNARLRDMIRQGKEALGTTYEVESYDDGMKGGDAWESDNDEMC